MCRFTFMDDTVQGIGIQPQFVFGIEIDDIEVAELVKKVLYVSGACFILISLNEIWRTVNAILYSQRLWLSLIVLVLSCGISLSIPACGWFGANSKNKGLICCFCSWSGVCAFLLFLSLIASIIYVASGPEPITFFNHNPNPNPNPNLFRF